MSRAIVYNYPKTQTDRYGNKVVGNEDGNLIAIPSEGYRVDRIVVYEDGEEYVLEVFDVEGAVEYKINPLDNCGKHYRFVFITDTDVVVDCSIEFNCNTIKNCDITFDSETEGVEYEDCSIIFNCVTDYIEYEDCSITFNCESYSDCNITFDCETDTIEYNDCSINFYCDTYVNCQPITEVETEPCCGINLFIENCCDKNNKN